MQFDTPSGRLDVSLAQAVIAGWTGRDVAQVQHHIDELAALGVTPPSQVPLYYRVAVSQFTQAASIQVVGPGSSGEVEPLLLRHQGQWWLGLGSDHTDRVLEAHGVAQSKQACAKPVAAQLWSWAEVQDHADQLMLSCDILEGGDWVSYQSGALSAIRPLTELMAGAALPDGGAMLCGTLPAIGGVREAAAYRMQLTDPVLQRSLQLSYSVEVLPIVQ